MSMCVFTHKSVCVWLWIQLRMVEQKKLHNSNHLSFTPSLTHLHNSKQKRRATQVMEQLFTLKTQRGGVKRKRQRDRRLAVCLKQTGGGLWEKELNEYFSSISFLLLCQLWFSETLKEKDTKEKEQKQGHAHKCYWYILTSERSNFLMLSLFISWQKMYYAYIIVEYETQDVS